jgi:hypothetical protein
VAARDGGMASTDGELPGRPGVVFAAALSGSGTV